MIVYCLTNRVTGKCYVGQTRSTLAVRMAQHRCNSCRGTGSLLHKSMRKHGLAAFDVTVLQTCDDQAELDRTEEWWIKRLGSVQPGGYNIKLGGNYSEMPESTRRKIGDANRGRVVSTETRQKLSLLSKGVKRTFTPEHRAALSLVARQRVVTPETRAAMSATRKGRKQSPEHIAKRIASTVATRWGPK